MVAAAAALVLLLGACGGTDAAETTTPESRQTGAPAAEETASDGTSTSEQPQKEATVSMTDSLTFEPATVVVEVGGSVTWSNDSDMDHTSTANKKKAADSSSVELPDGASQWNSGFVKPGESFTLTFDRPGTYRYFCIPHEKVGMVGVIEVVG